MKLHSTERQDLKSLMFALEIKVTTGTCTYGMLMKVKIGINVSQA